MRDPILRAGCGDFLDIGFLVSTGEKRKVEKKNSEGYGSQKIENTAPVSWVGHLGIWDVGFFIQL